MYTDVLIIGAGIAGITAAKTAFESGRHVMLVDREAGFGGVLRQCAHPGFGSGLTGPEYIEELLHDFPKGVELSFSTTVLEIRPDKSALMSSGEKGLYEVFFAQLILATGCMEITAGMLPIGGTRPQGIYTAGEAQLMSFRGEGFPSPVVILGSGDLGLIMARQLKEQGHEISCIIEKNAAPTAMARNRGILDEVPLILRSSISRINGSRHIESIVIEKLESGQERTIPCSTLLIAAGLKPDRALSHGIETVPWLTYCGNCHKIYTMAEGLAADAKDTAKAVCERI